MTTFHLGQKFSSFLEFEQYLSCYENENFVKFYKRDSRKIESAVRAGKTKVELNPDLIYYEVKYSCVRGGPYRVQGTGKRKTSSAKIECLAHISLRAAADGKTLEVKSFDNTHNHEASKALFDHLPQQRRLTDTEKDKARELLSLQANKKLIQQKLQEETGKIITLRDLSNLAKGVKSSSNELHEAVSLLQEKYHADVEVLKTEDNVFKALFFQTELMKLSVEAYPQFLAFDGTYKLLSLNLTTFVFLIEDGNCDSHIVGIALAADELQETLEWIVLQFKNKNLATSHTAVIMTDKDLAERNVFRKHFGHSQLMLCAFHTLRTFGREITTDKLNISILQKNACLEILQKMVTAKSEEIFYKTLEKFNNVAPDSVKLYYYKNFHTIREEWCKVFQMGKTNFLNCTNNRIECMNSKLKSTITKQSSLIDFINKLFSLLRSLENERLHAGISSLQRNRLIPQSDGLLYSYSQFLSPKAFTALEDQIKIFESKSYAITNKDDCYTINTTQEGIVSVSPTSCGCNFYRAMLLPCRHILALRHAICLPLYDENLVHKRWTKTYYHEYVHKISSLSASSEVQQTVPNVTTIKNQNPKSVQEKRKMALNVTNEIADIVSLLNMNDFNNCMHMLKTIKSHLQNGTKFQILENDEIQNRSGLCNASQNMPSTSGSFTSCSVPSESQNQNMPSTSGSFTSCSVPSESQSQNMPSTSGSFTSCSVPSESQSQNMPSTSGSFTSCSVPSESQSQNMPSTSGSFTSCSVPSESQSSKLSNSELELPNCPSQQAVALKSIQMPQIRKQRGRPKGHSLTVIGLPKKKACHSYPCGPVPFIGLSLKQKEDILLRCFVQEERSLTACINLIDENEVETIPENIPNKVIDKNVDLNLIKQYFTKDAWLIVEGVINVKKKNARYFCSVCREELAKKPSVCCDGCLDWGHIDCVGAKHIKKNKHFFCRKCST